MDSSKHVEIAVHSGLIKILSTCGIKTSCLSHGDLVAMAFDEVLVLAFPWHLLTEIVNHRSEGCYVNWLPLHGQEIQPF
jgi:hypothetical protein